MPGFAPTTIATERLRLRFLTTDDAPALYPIFSDRESMLYWSSPAWDEPAQAAAHIANALEGYASGNAFSLAITLAATGTVIGVCRLYAFNPQNRRCDIGYMLSRQHWGKGYMREALAALISHGFTALDLHRIEADIDPRNRASATLLERLHFQHEGHLRQRWIVAGEICDTDFYGLLRSDWVAAANHSPADNTACPP